MLGKLTLDAFKQGPIETVTGIMMVASLLGLIGYITYAKKWKYLWEEWFTSLDPKRIGVMYAFVSFVMLIKGVADAVLIRAQQAIAIGDSFGFLSATHFQQIFTAHGTTMIFFVGMGTIFALFNLIIPLQIGARDVAFPFLNAVSFWLFAVGASLVLVSLLIGHFSATGWVAYPPLSDIRYSPTVGVDYWIWSVQISGVGSLLSGVNFLATIFTMRCPGMTLLKMPIFVWAAIGSLVLIIFAFPILTATLAMLALDRMWDFHFFTPDFGGNAMMYINLIWAWGHPEVYILILPAFGVYSEVVATFSEKRLFGYISMIWAIIAITFLSFIVWLHHFFTMGAGPNVNAFFGIMTMLIAIPTGVKVFNWLFTMFRGKVHFTSPMIWFMGFVVVFTIGGMAGVLLSIAPVDFQLHNSLFLIAHFHSMVVGGVLFGVFAGINYWFPKYTGFKLNDTLGKCAAYCWIIGFIIIFIPLYLLGLMGATRRIDHHDASTGWQPLFIIAFIGAIIISIGIAFQIIDVIVSIKQKKKNVDLTGDPWNGRTLEWSTSSPPPLYNFAVLPKADHLDAFWEMKRAKEPLPKPKYEDIHMPKNSGMPLYIGILGFICSFALIWHMMEIAALSALGIIACIIIHFWSEEHEYTISAKELEKMEAAHAKLGNK